MGLRYHLTRTAKAFVATALYRTRLLTLARQRRTRGAATVLLYHRIVDRHPSLVDYSPSGMTLAVDAFETQMRYLQSSYDVVPLETVRAIFDAEGPMPDGLCAITFDDGWRDNYTHAFPILRAYRLPATIFLTPNFLDNREWFWEERLKYLIGHFYQRQLDGGVSDDDLACIRRVLDRLAAPGLLEETLPRLRRRLTALVNVWRTKSTADREDAMGQLERLLQRPALAEPRRFMTWDEVREMAQAGIAFGAHTESHVNLARCGAETASLEITRSRSTIERHLGRPVTAFAYPYGKNTPGVRALVSAAGFTAAFTTASGLIAKHDDRRALNRIDINTNVAGSLPYFACRALHLLGMY
ncbi:MAG: polysaccharide deacetylase family protein [Vicinamibacterales bacterium]